MKEKINKIVKYVKKEAFNISLILISLIFMILNFYDILYKFEEQKLIGNKYLIVYIICSVIIFFIIFVLIKNLKKLIKLGIPVLFVVLSIICGLPYVFLSPMFTGSDEHNHYYRIYEISELTMVTPTDKYVGSKLPKSLEESFNVAGGSNTSISYKDILDMSKIKLNKEEKVQYGKEWGNSYNNTALYSPATYLPHVIGFTIGNFFEFSPLIIGMLGRLTNFITFVILGYLSLKLIPKAKLFYLIVLISPNMLQLATTLSADAFTNVLVLLFIALLFKIYYQKETMNTKNKIILALISVFIALCKIVYIPIVCLLYFIPKKCYKSMKEKQIYSGIIILICIVVGLWWTKQTSAVFEIEYTNNPEQMDFVLNNIFEYFIIFVRTFSIYFFEFVESLFVGIRMYHSQLIMPTFISISYITIVILAFLKQSNKNKNSSQVMIVTWIVSLLTIALIGSAIYVQATAQYLSVKNPTIEGIQGRYFLPIVLLLPFLLQIKIKRVIMKEERLISIALVINLITYFYIMTQFII